ncbi:atypical membrane-integrating protein (Mistic protein) [Pseudalkalibacillus salsuginis]|uniref:atypical membrane-integrating protein (Mistic protein) n=1 Tax=Pseudalkalibacillus salsuginis TaxID=2910972 RepID=UPI001F36C8D7|nr:atypical membrane-integrating protein (Mistic protein) [Pseudalkalibacillus salsuginis]MCF6409333.1 atypical membrane-integrating protein (Mistic protein) [Pseudalkalibacillus salsuginis]
MKAIKREYNEFSRSIDKMSEGLDAIIELFNELEEDKPIIRLDDKVLNELEEAKEKYGEDFIHKKMNNLIREALSWLSAQENEEDGD